MLSTPASPNKHVSRQKNTTRNWKSKSNSDYTVSPIYALRVSAVIEDTLEKLQLLDLLSGDIKEFMGSDDQEKEEDEDALDQETNAVANILEDQKVLGKRYEQLSFFLRANKQDNHMSQSLEEINKVKDELEMIQRKLKDNTKKLCRNLKETPNELENWKKIQSERHEIQTIFVTLLREIQAGLIPPQAKSTIPKNRGLNYSTVVEENDEEESETVSVPQSIIPDVPYESFMKKVAEEKEKKQYLQHITEIESKTLEQVNKLKIEVIKEKELKKTEVDDRSTKVNTLLNKLRKLKKLTADEDSKTKATEEASHESRRRREASTLHKLESESRSKNIELEVEKNVFSQIKNFLEKKTDELKRKGEYWREKYEKESEELRSKIIQWEAMREEQIEKLKRLEEKFELETQDKQVQEDVDATTKAKEKDDAEKKIQMSADVIKMAFKCYKAREDFANRKKKKKTRSASNPKSAGSSK
ncbi:hypothetical protein NAEGRDRAFT_79803 [Naegleria gruberi]|uniref:IQ domain-containing protein D n=1 Tax=Naegleria gruberi TaxID=5762 RepID=D2VFR5_NAEGR|nr:uncharacterized protein NAEGRDRAFT_79803 [Naegleria gruberi]EFC44404.1 hypothetical protein NAEGRDRAFT_79803 [Naegleria gruberi]|eukprot:XP_002677148.1 hypothetical protein NAEGRDRAFT_79803 [Naegleria gruberi strain NEG-M]